MLPAFVLTFNNRTRRDVGDSYCTFGFVDVLTACAARTVCVYLQIGRVDFNINLFRFGKNGNRYGLGVASALPFGFRHTLNAMNSALKLEA